MMEMEKAVNYYRTLEYIKSRLQWPRGPRHEPSSPARTLGTWVRILLEVVGLVVWDLWWTKWRWDRFSPSTSDSPANLQSTIFSTITITYHLGLVVFKNWYSGEWSPIGSTRHCGHQWPIVPASDVYDDREIGGMIGRGTEVLGENLPQCRFVHHKPHMQLGREPGPPRWEAGV
jgi:hypothetical protein